MNQVLSAVKAVIQKENKFLVIKQNIGDDFIWDLPGGKVEFGESPYDTLKREVKEETDLEIEIIKPIGIWWFFHSKNGNQIACTTFICEAKNGEINLFKNPANEKIEEFKWVTKNEFLGEDFKKSHESLTKIIQLIDF